MQIWLDTQAQWLYVRWRGCYQEQMAEEGWAYLVQCLRQHPGPKLLNDARFAAHGWAGREQWAGEELFPQLAKWGVRYVACVYPHALPARFSLDTTLGLAPQPFLAAFDDLASACYWLQRR